MKFVVYTENKEKMPWLKDVVINSDLSEMKNTRSGISNFIRGQ